MAKNAHPGRPHKYLRIHVRGQGSVNKFRWRCIKPGCSHYLLEDFIIGATCECWRCQKEFTIDQKTKLMKPHCRECTRKKEEEFVESQPIEESPI